MHLKRFFIFSLCLLGLVFSGCKKHSENKSDSGAGLVQDPVQASGFLLTIDHGSFSGQYEANSMVTITANAAPAGKIFDKWIGALVTNPGLPTTTILMPTKDISVTAVYRDVLQQLTVINGSGSGLYAAGTVITISANPPPDGESFTQWIGPNIQNPAARTTTITMPLIAMTVQAECKPITAVPTY